MSYTPSVRTEADGSTTVDDGVTAGGFNAAITLADPTVAPVLTAVAPTGTDDNGDPYVALAAGTYFVAYAWAEVGSIGIQEKTTGGSPSPSITLDGTHALQIVLPARPTNTVGVNVISTNGMTAGGRIIIPDLGVDGVVTRAHPLIIPSDFLLLPFGPGDNCTADDSTLNGSAKITGTVLVEQDVLSDLGVYEWGAQPPNPETQPIITGALSSVTDAAAKAVLTSILAVLVGKGSASDGTT